MRKIRIDGSLAGIIMFSFLLLIAFTFILAPVFVYCDDIREITKQIPTLVIFAAILIPIDIYYIILYRRAAYALKGDPQMGKIEYVRAYGGKHAHTRIEYSYISSTGERIIGKSVVRYSYHKYINVGDSLKIYVNGIYGYYRHEDLVNLVNRNKYTY